MIGPIDMLQAFAGFAQAQDTNRAMRLATVDPTYDRASYPDTLPQVTFDGETTLSGKGYPVYGPYRPYPGDRVLLAPVGTTYAILGSLNQGVGSAPVRVVDATDLTAISNTAGAAGSPVCGTAFVAPQTGKVLITVRGTIRSGTITQATNLSYEVRAGSAVGSGTILSGWNAMQDRGLTVGRSVQTSAPAELSAANTDLLEGLTPGSFYNVRTMHWVSGGSGGSIDFRGLLVVPA